ncbi:NUDIX domain-containing protein [Streptomyces sp. NRRL S-350]|uniref:NUDIX domain-containing protein n=1 Tax=Streptomyces sp. NRRL S-350 TaxID=1463902 RepID=UPI0004C2A88F|nr:NUDIX domain-containing protein [Streptomyces sp. NRRL S-350]
MTTTIDSGRAAWRAGRPVGLGTNALVVQTGPDGAARYLLINRARKAGDPMGIPGGSVEEGQAPRDAVTAHLAQKVGITASAGLRLLGTDHTTARPGQGQVERHNWLYGVSVPADAVPQLAPTSGYDRMQWATEEEARGLLTGNSLARFTHVLAAWNTGTPVELRDSKPLPGVVA